MNTIAKNPALAKKMGQKARKLAEERYNLDRFGKDICEYFENLIR